MYALNTNVDTGGTDENSPPPLAADEIARAIVTSSGPGGVIILVEKHPISSVNVPISEKGLQLWYYSSLFAWWCISCP